MAKQKGPAQWLKRGPLLLVRLVQLPGCVICKRVGIGHANHSLGQ